MIYRHLFAPGKIGSVSLKNRIVMPPMGTNQSSANGELTEQQIRYYEERAKGGAGLIIIEITSVEYELGRATAAHPRIDDNKYIPMIHRLAEALHKYDTKVFMQLHHAGDKSNLEFTGGRQLVSPSGVMRPVLTDQPRALTNAEVKHLINKFIMGAVRCQIAGIDGVELHGAHSYLIAQFLSPLTNQRTDEYGGNFQNRMRFLEEIVRGIKKACGDEFPVTVRLSLDEFLDGGIDMELGKKMCVHLENLGVDALHISAGNYETSETTVEPVSFEQGWKVYLAEEVKRIVSIPVITVGVIREPKFAEAILEENRADFVAIGRGLIADPDWPNKARNGHEHTINKCISCLNCLTTLFKGCPISCAINARTGRELEFASIDKVDENNRHVVVVGGGPGGMEAARVLAMKGYGVTLFEREEGLGGQLNLANKPLRKEKIDWLIEYLTNELDRLHVDVRLNIEATEEEIANLFPYAVILATGSKNSIPKIEGRDLPHVFSYEDVLLAREEITNSRVAVIGAGMTGCETAELLALNDNDVSVIEATSTIGNGIDANTRMDILKYLVKTDVELISDHKLMKITENTIELENVMTEERITKGIDYVVMAMGVTSYNPLEAKLKEGFPNVFVIGDAKNPGRIAQAIKQGFEKAYVIESIVQESGCIPLRTLQDI